MNKENIMYDSETGAKLSSPCNRYNINIIRIIAYLTIVTYSMKFIY